MNTKDLIKSYSVTTGIPIGHKEALCFFVVADQKKPISIKGLCALIDGEPVTIRAQLVRLAWRHLVKFDVNKQEGRVYSLTSKGKSTLAKILK